MLLQCILNQKLNKYSVQVYKKISIYSTKAEIINKPIPNISHVGIFNRTRVVTEDPNNLLVTKFSFPFSKQKQSYAIL